jgi:hypothetical protein
VKTLDIPAPSRSHLLCLLIPRSSKGAARVSKRAWTLFTQTLKAQCELKSVIQLSPQNKNGPDFSGPGLNSKLPADYFFFFGAAFFFAGAFFLVAFFID